MRGNPVGSFDSVTIECLDPDALAAFWCEVFDTKIDTREGSPVDHIDLLPAAGAPTIRLLRVDEPKTAKDRMHIDVLVDDVERAVAQLEAAGATVVEGTDRNGHDRATQTMLDPEGNKFCLIGPED